MDEVTHTPTVKIDLPLDGLTMARCLFLTGFTNMKTSDHAKIFQSYIDRMSMKELKDILYHCESCYQEFLHGNENSQKNADVVLHSAILNVFERMLSADKNNIESTINQILNRKG